MYDTFGAGTFTFASGYTKTCLPSNGFYLNGLVNSAYENINVTGSNYATAFNTAKTWFINASNHPATYSQYLSESSNKDYDGYLMVSKELGLLCRSLFISYLILIYLYLLNRDINIRIVSCWLIVLSELQYYWMSRSSLSYMGIIY